MKDKSLSWHITNIVLWLAMILMVLAYGISFFWLISRSLMESGELYQVPDELIEAAKLDGASELQTYIKVILPLMKASITTVPSTRQLR